MMTVRSDLGYVVTVVMCISCSGGVQVVPHPPLVDSGPNDIGCCSEESRPFDPGDLVHGDGDDSFLAVMCAISVDGSNAVGSTEMGFGTDNAGSPPPIDGGAGGTIEVFSGVKADTGDGSDGSIEGPVVLGPGEYKYHHVAVSDWLTYDDDESWFPEIKVSGHVIIRCQTMFCAVVTAADPDGEPPCVEIYAGPPSTQPISSGYFSVPYPYRNHMVYCTLGAPDGNEPVRGGTVVFHTTQFGAISPIVSACGGDGADGGNGGNGGSLRIFANIDSVSLGSCLADGGDGADGPALGRDGGHGGNGGKIALKAASDPDFPVKPDAEGLLTDRDILSEYEVLRVVCSAVGGDGGHGAYGNWGKTGESDETGGQTDPDMDGSGTAGEPGGHGGDGGNAGSIRIEGELIDSHMLCLEGGRGGDGGNGGTGGDGAYGISGSSGEYASSGTGGNGEDGTGGGNGGNGAAGGHGGQGGVGGLCLCLANSIYFDPIVTVEGGDGGCGGRGGVGGAGRRGGSGGGGGRGDSGGNGGHGAPGGDGGRGASGGDGGLGGAAGQIVYRFMGSGEACESVPDSSGVDGFVPLAGDVVEDANDGLGGDGGAGGNGGSGGYGGRGGESGYASDPYGMDGVPGRGDRGGNGGDGGSGGAGLNGGDGGAGGNGGNGGSSSVVAGDGGNGGAGADGGDSRSDGMDDTGATDWQDPAEDDGYQPGDGGAGGNAGAAGAVYDPSNPQANAGQPGNSGNSGLIVPAEVRDETQTLPPALPCGAKPVVVFVPGIAGSVLMGTGDDGMELLWPTISPTDVGCLRVNASGAQDVRAVDILREVQLSDFIDTDLPSFLNCPVESVYQPLIDFLVAQGFVEFDLKGDPERLTSDYMLTAGLDPKPTLFPFPYDWRLDNAYNATILRLYIDRIRQLHPDHDVFIVAHSMGGLIARRCILDNAEGIGKVATMGTPFWGAPVAIYRMLEGEFFGSGVKDILDWVDNDAFSEALCTMPGFFQLLPSDTYLAHGGRPVMSEDGWDANHDSLDGPYTDAQYWGFVDEAARPHQAAGAEKPSEVNKKFHSPDQDDWRYDSTQIWYYHIVGDLLDPDTTTEVVAEESLMGLWHEYVEVKGPGDGTVPLLSASRLSEFYAPDPRTISTVVWGGPDYAAHMSLPKNEHVLESILDFFYGTLWSDPSADYSYDGQFFELPSDGTRTQDR